MSQVTLKVNDREISCEKGTYILQLCRELGIEVPTMCQNDALTPGGHCRLCLIELREGDWSKVVTSCLFPAKEGQTFYTDTPKVQATRKTIIELMLARAPKAPAVQALAEKYIGSQTTPYEIENDTEKCILCGQCVEACEEVVGVSAIGVSSRGIFKKVTTPFDAESDTCIGCGACAFVCPTDAIPMTETKGVRRIWDRDFELVTTSRPGSSPVPKAQIEWMQKEFKVDPKIFK
jgi:bidirectional [NiFe] hydrogenase diaphorase subunit